MFGHLKYQFALIPLAVFENWAVGDILVLFGAAQTLIMLITWWTIRVNLSLVGGLVAHLLGGKPMPGANWKTVLTNAIAPAIGKALETRLPGLIDHFIGGFGMGGGGPPTGSPPAPSPGGTVVYVPPYGGSPVKLRPAWTDFGAR